MLFLVRLWIYLNVLLVAGGWTLSAAHALDRGGYACLAALGLLGAWSVFRGGGMGRLGWRLVPLRRFRRRLPFLFLVLLLISLLGGALWRPEFADGLAYRTPRVLHWLHQHGWEWIDTMDVRKNNRGVGFEWATAPLLLFTHSDRPLFLINTVSFALLPGLIFCFLRRSWVSPRVAWAWCWVLAGATGFALQAGSIGADLLAVPFYLAAIVFARRAAETRRWSDVAWSALAIALTSNVKPFNVVFFLPWLISIYPALRELPWRRPWPLAWLAPLAAVCSFLPLAAINLQHTGSWMGLTPAREGQLAEYSPASPAIGFIGNAWLITSQNLLPPFVPKPSALLGLQARLEATPAGARFQQSFEHLFFVLREQETEATAGLGLGVVLLLVATACFAPRGARLIRPPPSEVRLADLSVWVGLFAFMVKAGAYEAGRLVLPFYIPLLPPLLRRAGCRSVLQRRWWKRAAIIALLYTAAVLLLSRGRPLLPWESILGALHRVQPASPTWPRALAAVQAHHRRADLFSGVRAALPPEEQTIGLLTGVARAATLWLPYGSRFVVDVLETTDSAALARLEARGVRYVVIPATAAGVPRELEATRDYLEHIGTVVQRVPIEGTLSQKGEEWLVVRLP